MSERVRASVRIEGVVQGVGFRPFVYRTATSASVGGYVLNAGDHVDAAFEGNADAVETVLDALESENPPLARVTAVDVSWTEPTGAEEFEIRDSRVADDAGDSHIAVPPDTGICERCLDDVRDRDSRYHGYWATSCVDCGPRYTVVRNVPYDRQRTSMDDFPMCDGCRSRYDDPADRRYHAQTVACPECGPALRYERNGDVVATDDAIERAGQALADGAILGIKGTGGTHLVCEATDPETVETLRERTGRPNKPFALMADAVSSVTSFATVTPADREALTDLRRPITVLEQARSEPWLAAVAPGLHTVGVMLPYTGLHHLLFERVDGPLVMTSANRPGEPMVTTATALWERLGSVVDGALCHDREIVARCDDSVVRTVDGTRRFLRRSRGWTPRSLPNPAGGDGAPPLLAVGPSRDVTVAVGDGSGIVLSQHVGAVDGPDGLAFHRETVDRLSTLAGIDPTVIACDRHPKFVTTDEATRRSGRDGPVRVGHHHAHAAALCAEHDHERALVVTADGTGYGPDGTIWGGEVLDTRYDRADRVGGLASFSLPGGDRAVRYPARILAGLSVSPEIVEDRLVETGAVETPADAAVVRQQAETGTNAPTTTSAGRYLDAVSALLGACGRRTYQGEPALRLEALASEGTAEPIDLPFGTEAKRRVLDTPALVSRLATMAEEKQPADIAATAQDALARGLGAIAIDAACDRGVETVGFTGGVAYNESIHATLRQTVTDAGLTFLGPDRVPAGDGGVAYGQAIVATARRTASSDLRTPG